MLAQYDYAALQAELTRAGQTTRMTIRLLTGAMAAAILLSLYLSYRLSRSLLRPIKALTSSAVALGDGVLDRPVPVLSHDELGELARAFNTMAGKLARLPRGHDGEGAARPAHHGGHADLDARSGVRGRRKTAMSS